MNIAVCCIIKKEANYIREFVEYYKKQGVNKIYLYDNNDGKEDYPFSQINDYIINKFVYVINYRNKKNAKLEAYNECYKLYNNYYDWMLFVDCDEYVETEKDETLYNFLLKNSFTGYDVVRINLKVYNDNNYLDASTTYSCNDRFTQPSLTTELSINNLAKSLVRCKLKQVIWENQFYPITLGNHCNCFNENIYKKNQVICKNPIIYIKDFITKSVTEFCDIKLSRSNLSIDEINNYINFFFTINEKTEEKQKIIDKYLINNIKSTAQIIY